MAIQTDNFGMSLGSAQDLVMMENLNMFDFIPQHNQLNSSFGDGDQINHVIHDQNHTSSLDFCESIMENQTVQFINLQYERLRLAIHEQRRQQTTLLLKECESRVRILVSQKEEEIVRAMNRKMELENILAKLEAEKQTWHRLARENEAVIVSLRDRIEQLSLSEDAESFCVGDQKTLFCRCCNSRNSCVVILPCRHLCSCQTCEVFLDSCPVCRIPKKATIQALF